MFRMSWTNRSIIRWAPIASRAGRRYYGQGLRRAYRNRYINRRLYARRYARRRMMRYW